MITTPKICHLVPASCQLSSFRMRSGCSGRALCPIVAAASPGRGNAGLWPGLDSKPAYKLRTAGAGRLPAVCVAAASWSASCSNPAYRTDLMTLLDVFALLCVAVASALTLFCELFFIKDIYTNRFNTMTKFWYQCGCCTVCRRLTSRCASSGGVGRVLSLAWERRDFSLALPRLALPGRAFWAGLAVQAIFSILKQRE